MSPRRPLNATATATLDSGAGSITGAVLCAGADAATATIKTGGSGGTVIAKLGVGIGLSTIWNPGDAFVEYSNLHVTITGTTPQFTAFV